MKRKGMSCKQSYLAIGLIPMLLTTVIIGVFCSVTIKSHLEDGIYSELRVSARQVKEYFEYDIINNGNVDYEEYADHKYIESLEPDNIELTLFQGDTRLLTSLKNEKGEYNEGTQAHPEIYKEVSSGNEYDAMNVDIGGKDYMVVYLPIYDANDQFWGMAFAGELQEKASKPVNSVILTIILIVLAQCILLGIAIYFFARKLAKTLITIKDRLNTLSEGNLEVDFSMKGMLKEFNEVIFAGNNLQKNLDTIIGDTQHIAKELQENASQVHKSAQNSQTSANQITAAMDDLAQSAVSMAENVQNINDQVGDIDLAVNNIYESTEKLVEISSSMKSANKEASDYINRVASSSEQSVTAVNDITNQINDTNAAVSHIKNAVEMISSIASQTNLLALNASIEAARAGEAGKGFAVVADEIKTLSEQTNASTTEINQIVEEIVTKSEKSVALSSQVTDIIAKEQEDIQETKNKFNVLNAEIGKSITEIDDISDKVTKLNAAKTVITGSVEDLSAVSEQNAASNEEVNASVTGITDSISSIADSSVNTDKSVDKLLDTISYFK